MANDPRYTEGVRSAGSSGDPVRSSGAVEVSSPARPSTTSAEQSLGDLFSDLIADLSTIVRQEIDLARTETMEKISKVTRSVVLMVAGGLIAYAGLIAIVIAAAIALGSVIPYWLSALIVGIVVIAVGGVLILSGRNSLKQLSIVPEKTVETISETTEWAKEQL